jgi:hypothetical protein
MGSNLRHCDGQNGWLIMKNGGKCREKPIPICQFKTCTSSSVEVSIFIKKTRNPVNTCKLDSGVKMHSEISKKKIFLDFLDMIYEKKNHSHHTPMYKALHILMIYAKVDPIARLRPRIFHNR